MRVVGDELQVFYTQRGDTPERVQLSTIDLTADFDDWVLVTQGKKFSKRPLAGKVGNFRPTGLNWVLPRKT